MPDDSAAVGDEGAAEVHVHTFGDPKEAADHFTPERRAQARPRHRELSDPDPVADETGSGA